MAAVDNSSDREILTGDFGLFTQVERTAGSTTTDNIPTGDWIEVAAKATSNSKFGTIPVGGLYYNPTAAAISVTSGDTYYVLTENVIGFARGWSVELNRNNIDTTALKDLQSTSIFGRTTVTGNINGFLVANDGEAEEALKRFMTIYKISDTGVATTVARDTGPLSFIGYTLKRSANKNIISAYYLPSMDIGTLTVGSEVGGLQDFTVPLALRSGEVSHYVVDIP